MHYTYWRLMTIVAKIYWSSPIREKNPKNNLWNTSICKETARVAKNGIKNICFKYKGKNADDNFADKFLPYY